MYKPTPQDLAEVGLKDSGTRQEFSTGAVRDNQGGKGRYDLLPMFALFRLARVFEKGAIKYDADNWRKGIPLRRYLDSALRHICKFAEGHRDEDHAAQALWNIACLIETEHMIQTGQLPQSLNDLPDWSGHSEPEIIGSEAQ
jgi:hypothetical protein